MGASRASPPAVRAARESVSVSDSAAARSGGENADEAGGGGEKNPRECNGQHVARPPFDVRRLQNLAAKLGEPQPCIPGVSQPCPVRYSRGMRSTNGDVDDAAAASLGRRGESVIGALLTAVGVIGTASGTLFLALASREPVADPVVPGGFLTAIAMVLAGIAAIVIGSALRRGSAWARRLVLRR